MIQITTPSSLSGAVGEARAQVSLNPGIKVMIILKKAWSLRLNMLSLPKFKHKRIRCIQVDFQEIVREPKSALRSQITQSQSKIWSLIEILILNSATQIIVNPAANLSSRSVSPKSTSSVQKTKLLRPWFNKLCLLSKNKLMKAKGNWLLTISIIT